MYNPSLSYNAMYINSAMWDNMKSLVTLAKNYSREILHQSISEDQFAVDSTQYSGRMFIVVVVAKYWM